MAKRRPAGDGMVRKRDDGRWEGRIVIGHRENGEPLFRHVYAKTQKALLDKLHQNIECYRYILKGQRLLTLNAKAEPLLKQIPETDLPYVFLNPKTGVPYKLHEFYYLHKKILKQARLPWVAFRNLQCQCMEVGI